MGLKAPNWFILNMPHDLYRSLFFIPVLYAAHRFRMKGVIATTVISMLIFLPRALFISPYLSSLIRSIVFIIGLWFSGFFFATALNAIAKRKQAEGRIRESEEKFRATAVSAQDAIIMMDNEGNISYWNEAAERMFGYKKNEIIGKHLHKILVPERFHESYLKGFKRFQITGEGAAVGKTLELAALRKNGTEFPIELSLSAVKLKGKWNATGIIRDITERKKVEEALRGSEELKGSILSSISHAVVGLEERQIMFANKAVETVFGWKPRELIGKDTRVLYRSDEEYEQIALHFYPLLERQKSHSEEFHCRRKDGKDIICRVTASRIGEKLEKKRIVVVYEDITERKQAEEKIKYMGFHDALTGLYNRAYFEEELKRLNTLRNYPLAVIMADINGLKVVNDTLGHDKGDELLKNLAKVLKSVARKEDMVARIGGDEFAVILPHADENAAQAFCNRFEEARKEYNKKAQIKLSVALGYAVQSGQYKDMEKVLEQADENMYAEKLSNIASREKHIIDTIMTVLAARDPHTQEHAERLQNLSEALGRDIGLSEFKLKRLRLLALLHDIGKIGTPDSILFKPTKLTEEEWEIMKKHSEEGYKMATNIPQLVPIARDILYHHERWDGTGYPKGLKGKEIPILSRIISIVDAYDVMLTERPYKKAMSKQEAIKELKENQRPIIKTIDLIKELR